MLNRPKLLLFVLLIVLELACVVKSNPKYEQPTYRDNQQSPQRRGLGISAWGIVFLIITVILLGVGAYYAAVFYPLLCKKERKYDRIELSTG